MYYYGNCCSNPTQATTTYSCCGTQGRSNYAIVLVLFILLVIIIGSRITN